MYSRDIFPGVKRQGVVLTTHSYLTPRLKSRAIPLLHLWAFLACYRTNFTFYSRDLFAFGFVFFKAIVLADEVVKSLELHLI